jgi:uncharacterized protein YlxW (UPF0749 family)
VTWSRTVAYGLVALAALAFGFLLAAQLRTQLLVPGNQVARNAALIRSVQDLEKSNAAARAQVASLRGQVNDLESAAARRSDSAKSLEQQVRDLRSHAGLTVMRGPGVTVTVANGQPGPDLTGRTAYLVNFQDIQDVVNTLYGGGAEGVAVNGQRVTPGTAFGGSGSAVVIDQGEPLSSPFKVTAVGDRGQMEQLLSQPSVLGDLRERARRYNLQLAVTGAPDLSLPASDASQLPRYAQTS